MVGLEDPATLRARGLPAACTVVLLAVAPATMPQQAMAIPNTFLERPVVALMGDREAVDAAIGDERLSVADDVTSGRDRARAALSYLLRRDVEELAGVEAGALPREGLLYLEEGIPIPSGEIVYERGNALIVRPDHL